MSDFRVSFINQHFRRVWAKHKNEFLERLNKLGESGQWILGEEVEQFEKSFAEFVGTKYAVGVCCGTHAIYLALKALNIKGIVALPSHTFKATASAVLDVGANPILYDYNGVIGQPVNAHIPVHIAGEIFELKKYQNVPIIEDACQAIGAVKNPISDAQCWSFYPAKILGSLGDAGAITTNREDVYNYVKEARNHFKGTNQDFGGNYRMDTLQAAWLNIRLRHIDEILVRRKEIAERYLRELKDLEEQGFIKLPNEQKGRVWQDWILQTEKRDQLLEFLRENGIETMKNEYPFPAEYPKLPKAAKYEAETLRIPCNENLTEEEQSYVIQKIKEFFKGE